MRKFISMAAAALLFVGVISCSKNESGNPDGNGTGSVTVTFAISDVTRAVTSTARPTTTWENVDNLMILFVHPTTLKVEDARAVTLPAVKTGAESLTQTLYDVKASVAAGWDTYVVGNYPSGWNLGWVVGKTINEQLKISAPGITVEDDVATVNDDEGFALTNSGAAYGEAPEIFVARKTGVVITNGGNLNLKANPFKLARAVSLIRIRVDQNPTEAPDNAKIDFSNAIFAIRRATTTYAASGTYTYLTPDVTTGFTEFPGTYTPAAPQNANVFFSNEALKTAEPLTGYDFGETPSPIMATDIDGWNEYLIWAGGNRDDSPAENAKRFDIVLSGVTEDDTYIPVGETDPVDAGTRIYWTGAVDAIVGPNQILELDLTLKTSGGSTTPDVGEYGNLEIQVDLVGWGDIIGVDMDL